MNLFIERHQELLSNLISCRVDFIIIGGYSVIFHGYHRTTGDVDIWLKPDNANKHRLIEALQKFEIEDVSLESIASLDFNGPLAFHIWNEPEKAEFLTKISGIAYEAADLKKIVADIDGLQIPFLHLDHLILSKMSAGRLRDLADVEELQRIQENRG